MDGLVQLGVKASCTLGTGCPPVEVLAEGLPSGKVSLSGSVSSQYLTALLMAAPLATGSGARARCAVSPGAAAGGVQALWWLPLSRRWREGAAAACCTPLLCMARARRRLRIRKSN